MISYEISGSTTKTQDFLKSLRAQNLYSGLEGLAQRGVSALQAATPQATGLTAASWDYEIEISNGNVKITWINTHTEGGVNIAVILQYGHGTGTGGYVAGRDYINGALQPIFDEIADQVWKKVTNG